MPKQTIRDLDLAGKRVFVRVDFNVPLEEKDGQIVITDATRIQETLPTIKFLIEKGARIILASHLGRPKGQRDPKQSLAPVAPALSALIGKPVAFASECVGDEAKAKALALGNGGVLLLENTRFHAGEEKNDATLAKGMADLAEVFVNGNRVGTTPMSIDLSKSQSQLCSPGSFRSSSTRAQDPGTRSTRTPATPPLVGRISVWI